MIINDHEIYSQSVLSGTEEYPNGIIESLKKAAVHVVALKASKIAEDVGNARTQNIVLLGLLVVALGLLDINWQEVMKCIISEKMLEVNLKALKEGMSL